MSSSAVDEFLDACQDAIRKKSHETFGYAKKHLAYANSSGVVKNVAKRVISLRTAVFSNSSASDVSLTDDDSAEDPKTFELLERVDLVEKYDKGTDNQEIDEWENPNFDLYKKTDRYGFMHEDEAQLEDFNEEKAKDSELRRERKWIKMIRDWDKYKHSIKLRRRIFKGIPEKLRSVVWGQLLNISKNRQPGVYEQLRLRARFLSKDLKQIDLDINRTYRNHIFFRRRYDLKQRALFHVLAAYAMFNTQVGYCQGMSQVAALLLMYFDEEDAFWALHSLMCDESHAMHGLFVPGFPKLLRFQQHHDRILKKMLPKLKRHMDKCEIHTALYSTKWYFQCFLDRVPFTLALRFWDNFILDGDIVLTGAAYCIMKMHQKTLLKLNFEQTMEFLQIRLEENFGYPNDIAVESLRNCIAELRRSKLLEPPEPDKAERPTKPFGEILSTPLDDIKRSLSVALSRKRHSRTPSVSQSMPVTPQHRNATPLKSQPQAIFTVVSTHHAASANSVPFQITSDSSASPSPLLAPSHVDGPTSLSYNDIRTSSYNSTGDEKIVVDGVQPRRRDGSKSPSASSTGFKPTVRHVPSFYDNLPSSSNHISPANHYASSEERMEMEIDGDTPNGVGGFTYVQKGQFSKKSETVTTTYVKNVLDGSNSNKNYSRSTRHDPMISSGPNYVTNVEVDPEWRYSYGSGSNTSQKSPQVSPVNAVFVGSHGSLASSPSKKPGKFPIGPNDLWGGGDASTSPSKRSINTTV